MYNICANKYIFYTYRNTLTFDAVHDPKGWAEVREPCRAELFRLLAELAFCNKHDLLTPRDRDNRAFTAM